MKKIGKWGSLRYGYWRVDCPTVVFGSSSLSFEDGMSQWVNGEGVTRVEGDTASRVTADGAMWFDRRYGGRPSKPEPVLPAGSHGFWKEPETA